MRSESTITFEQIDETIKSQGDETLLESARRHGFPYLFSCQTGRCGSCKSNLIEGSVEHLSQAHSVLTEKEKIDGTILACQVRPLTDIKVSCKRVDLAAHAAGFKSTVIAVEKLNHDTIRLRLKSHPSGKLSFNPGQFTLLKVDKNSARYVAIANQITESALELFVRKSPSALFNSCIDGNLNPGDQVEVEGPFGESYLRHSHAGPVLLVAGGSGLAPILSIATAALKAGSSHKIILYFGVQNERDVFCATELSDLAKQYRNFNYSIVVGRSSLRFRTAGKVRQAVLSDWPRFEGTWQAYLAGPPPMLEKLIPELANRGITKSDIFTSPFLPSVIKPA